MKKILLALGSFTFWAGFLCAAPPLELLPAGSEGRVLVPADGSLGLDWTTPAFDDLAWTYVIPPVGFDTPPPPVTSYADSYADFSGTQGQRNWFYGYWNKTADPDGSFQTWDFTPFPREAGNNTPGPDNFWDGTKWMFQPFPPWTQIWADGGHPNGAATTAGVTHYVIRRWLSSQAGPVYLVGTLTHTDTSPTGCGDGVDLHIYVDGAEVYSAAVYSNTVSFAVNASVQTGSVVDFAIGPGAAQNEWCDGHSFRVKILPNAIADSVADWSTTGQQGFNGWSYGYYDRTADADGTYQTTDFTLFPHDGAGFSATDFWDGGSWNWFAGDPPWTTITQYEWHPNGANSGNEQWPIRRWVSSYTGKVFISGVLGKPNYCGDVRGHIFLDGAEIMNRYAGGLTMAYAVVADVIPGSVLDFALDPNGGDACDMTTWTATIQPAADGTTLIADSIVDFSGAQGFNNWQYGYYNLTADPDGTYQASDFSTAPPWFFDGGAWRFDPANPPWSTIGEQTWHPNGVNSAPNQEQWPIRRWTSPVSGPLSVCYHFAKENGGGGGGTTLQVFQNGALKDTLTLSGTDRTGATRIVDLVVAAGDSIDFALEPLGADGGRDDGADGSCFNAFIFNNTVNATAQCALVADSMADWSGSGAQGNNGWLYGYYNKTGDGDGIYQAADFNNTDPNWWWTGGSWDLGATGDPNANPPWNTIGQVFWHPNSFNNGGEYWSVRRWVSNIGGNLRVESFLAKAPGNTGGNGVSGLVFHNGVLKGALTIAGDDTIGRTGSVMLTGVAEGDTIDYALSPTGAHGTTDDGADGSVGWARIYFCSSPGDLLQPPGLAAQMKGVNTSVYVRQSFGVPNLGCVDKLMLGMNYKDGFVAYLNGVEVARRNGPRQLVGAHPASSVTGWSPNGVQGNNGWYYGYYNRTADAIPGYAPEDFAVFPHDLAEPYGAGNYWNGGGWRWPSATAPWDTVGQTDWHPNGDNSGPIHYVIRRWVSSVEGDVVVNLKLRKTNLRPTAAMASPGTCSIMELSSSVGPLRLKMGPGFNVQVPVTGVRVGDTLDFALDPFGTDSSYNDGCDGSDGSMDVRQEYAPLAPAWNSRGQRTSDPGPGPGGGDHRHLRFQGPAGSSLQRAGRPGLVRLPGGTAVLPLRPGSGG